MSTPSVLATEALGSPHPSSSSSSSSSFEQDLPSSSSTSSSSIDGTTTKLSRLSLPSSATWGVIVPAESIAVAVVVRNGQHESASIRVFPKIGTTLLDVRDSTGSRMARLYANFYCAGDNPRDTTSDLLHIYEQQKPGCEGVIRFDLKSDGSDDAWLKSVPILDGQGFMFCSH